MSRQQRRISPGHYRPRPALQIGEASYEHDRRDRYGGHGRPIEPTLEWAPAVERRGEQPGRQYEHRPQQVERPAEELIEDFHPLPKGCRRWSPDCSEVPALPLRIDDKQD